MGITDVSANLDFDSLHHRITAIQDKLRASVCTLLDSQGVRMLSGSGRLKGPHEVVVDTADGVVEELEADVVLLSTGSRPRMPDWAPLDGERVLTTREAYPPPELPEHLVVVGSGSPASSSCTCSRPSGARSPSSSAASRSCPRRIPRWPPPSRRSFSRRGVRLSRGPEAIGMDVEGEQVTVRCDDGRVATGSHALLAIGSIPNSERLGLERSRRRCRSAGTCRSTTTASPTSPTSTPPATCRASSRCRRWPPCRGARSPSTSWGPARRAPPPPRLREGGVGHLHRARDRRCGAGRGRGVRRSAARSG